MEQRLDGDESDARDDRERGGGDRGARADALADGLGRSRERIGARGSVALARMR